MTVAIDIARTRRYIDELELPETPDEIVRMAHPRIELTDKDAACVDAGSIIALGAGLESQQKQDTLNSTLLAQLRANKVVPDRERHAKEWYAEYRSVLENIGWVVSGWQFTEYKSSSSSFKIDTIVLGILRAIATQSELMVAIAALEALKKCRDDDKQSKVWETNSHSAQGGLFQIGSATSSGDNVSVAMTAFHFTTTDSVKRVLWTEYHSANSHVYTAGQTLVLNEQIYEKVRDEIVAKLGNKAVQYVADLDI